LGGQEFLSKAVFFHLERGVGEMAKGVDDVEVFGGGRLEKPLEGIVAVIAEGFKELDGGDAVAGAADLSEVGVAVFVEELDDGFDDGFGAVNGFQVFEVILVTALDPIGDVLMVEAAAVFAQFLDDNVVWEAVVEHAVEHIADFPGQTGDLAVAAWGVGLRVGFNEFVGDEVDFGRGCRGHGVE
jgi:hypothetical protein